MPQQKIAEATVAGYASHQQSVKKRIVAEWYDDSPRMYVREQRNDGDGWTTVDTWELHPQLGVTHADNGRGA